MVGLNELIVRFQREAKALKHHVSKCPKEELQSSLLRGYVLKMFSYPSIDTV